MSETPSESGLPSRSVSTPETKAARAASRSAESEEAGMIRSHLVFQALRPTRRVQSSESSEGSLSFSS
jgi:hypothetical protein